MYRIYACFIIIDSYYFGNIVNSMNCLVPVIAPRLSTAMRTSATQIEMKWEPLSPVESRGFLKGYKVTYAPSILGCTVTDQVVSFFTVENRLVLNGLSPQKEYCVSLSAFTVKGNGIASNKTLIQGSYFVSSLVINYTLAFFFNENSL